MRLEWRIISFAARQVGMPRLCATEKKHTHTYTQCMRSEKLKRKNREKKLFAVGSHWARVCITHCELININCIMQKQQLKC